MSFNNKKDTLEKNKKDKYFSFTISQKTKIILINLLRMAAATLVSLIFSWGYYSLLKPKYEYAEKSLKNYSQKLENYNKRSEYFKSLNKKISNYNNLDPDIVNKIDLMLPKIELFEKLFTEFEAFFNNEGLTVNSINISPDKELNVESKSSARKIKVNGKQKEKPIKKETLNEIGKINVNVNLSGISDYNDLKKTLETIENNIRIMDIENINFSGNGNLVLNITTYYQN